jgi:zinc transport system substrate-binding protein
MKVGKTLVAATVALAALAAGCESQKSEDEFVVAVSIVPYAAFVEAIAGDAVSVVTMIPPNAQPNLYDPKPSQMKALESAKIYFAVGADFGFENIWLEKFRGLAPEMRVVNCAEGISTLDHNPHVWLGPVETRTIIDNAHAALVEALPEKRRTFDANRATALARLDSIDAKIEALLADDAGKFILVYHPSWNYFCREYGINQLALERHGKEPKAGDLEETIATAKRHGVRVVFVQKQFNEAPAETVAKELGAEIEELNPLPEDPFAAYIETAKKIDESLR